MRLLVVFAAVIAAVAAEVYFEERFEDGGTYVQFRASTKDKHFGLKWHS